MKKLIVKITLLSSLLFLSTFFNDMDMGKLKSSQRNYTYANGLINENTIIKKPVWELNYYVDEFEDETNEKYLKAKFTGKYDDKIRSGKCDFIFFIDNYVYMQIFKEGLFKIAEAEFISMSYKYHITLKTEDGLRVSFGGQLVDDKLQIDNYGSRYIIDCLKKSSSFKLSIVEDIYNDITKNIMHYAYTKYLVEINSDNFNTLYWK